MRLPIDDAKYWRFCETTKRRLRERDPLGLHSSSYLPRSGSCRFSSTGTPKGSIWHGETQTLSYRLLRREDHVLLLAAAPDRRNLDRRDWPHAPGPWVKFRRLQQSPNSHRRSRVCRHPCCRMSRPCRLRVLGGDVAFTGFFNPNVGVTDTVSHRRFKRSFREVTHGHSVL